MLPVLATKNSQRVMPTLQARKSFSSEWYDIPPLSSMEVISGSAQNMFSHLFSCMSEESIWGKSSLASQKMKFPFSELNTFANNNSSDSSSGAAYISTSESE